jgi:O-antigen/teichoic acid export membrane protein
VDELAGSNVNRSYSLAATSLSIFTFTLVFLYPRIATGEVNALIFQTALAVMGVATFSFVFAAFLYYGSSVRSRIGDLDQIRFARQGDRLWVLGVTLLFLGPSLILAAVGLLLVGAAWFALWLAYLVFLLRYFPRVQTPREK